MDDQCTQDSLESPNDLIAQKDEKISKNMKILATTCQFANNYVTKFTGDLNFRVMKNFSLRSNNLTNLPENLAFPLVNVKSLHLADNELINVPLKFLTKLKQLCLDNKNILYLPPTVMEMTHLTILRLTNNFIMTLPESLSNLRSLEILILSCNKLIDLPESYETMNTVKVLDLSGNYLKYIPLCIVNGMNSLETLNLSNNYHINLTSRPSSGKLKKFYVRAAKRISKFPMWIFTENAEKLEVLHLDGTTFDSFVIPEKSSHLGMKTLSLTNCHIGDSSLDKIISLTNELVVLRAGNVKSCDNDYNNFWEVKFSSLKHPTKVKKIHLASVGLPSICTNIKNFLNLVKLDVSGNTLNWLPNEICQLKKLEFLIVSENSLSSLPDDIGQIILLKELKARNNHLAYLPVSSRELKNLAYLDLYKNEFENIPEDVKYMEKLIGLDIDQNYIEIEDFSIRGIRYKVLRKKLRNRYNRVEFVRNTGPRYEAQLYEDSDTSCDNSLIDYSEYSDQAMGNVTETIEENWDISEDSADEYDPTADSGYPVKKAWTNFSYVTARSRQSLFCPAKLHPPLMKQQIAHLREKGFFPVYTDDQVEGQFNDV